MTASQFFLAVLLATFQSQTQAYDKVFTGSEDLRNVTNCNWNCKVTESDLVEKLNKDFTRTRVIEVAVTYKMKVDEKYCANETPLNSSTVVTEKLQIWRPANDNPSSFASAFERVLELLFPFDHEIYGELQADCNLTLARRTALHETIKDLLLDDALRGHLGDLDINFDRMNTSNSTGNITDNQLIRSNGWVSIDLQISAIVAVFYVAFVYYSPTFLCLFTPIVVTENGIRHISLERTSPVGLRNLIGRCFYSQVDNFWHRTKTFIAQTVLMPLPFLIPAIGFDYLFFQYRHLSPNNFLIIFDLFGPSQLVCCTCYFLQAVYDSFLNVSQTETPCFVCAIIKSSLRCNDNLPHRILNHLRLQPLIFVKCCRLFCKWLVSYFRISRVVLPFLKVSTGWITWLLRVPILLIFIVFLSSIPAATVILLLAMLVVVSISIFVTSPIMTILFASSFYRLNGIFNSVLVVLLLQICVRLLAIFGACIVLVDAAMGLTTSVFVIIIILFSEKSLPYVACFILVCYYLWSSYSSFTKKYHDLSLMLYKFYRQSQQHELISKEQLQLDDEEIDTPNSDTRVYEVTIPEGLFDTACEDLMPVREGVCTLLLKVTSILSFVYLTFLLILRMDIGATPVMQALATFFTGSFPKILAIYFDRNRQRRYESTVIEEKVSNIVQNYMKGTPMIIEMVTFKDNDSVSDQN